MPLDAIDELATGFEGCEKKVEVDFHLSSPSVDLRHIPRDALDSILDLAKCTIISAQHNTDFDAYVLSESSLFVYPSKVMLKTCGTTLLLKCVSALLSAARSLGAQPDFLQFSRSNFLFPSKQHFPHRAFNEETDYLNEQLGIKGDAFILGSLNGARWHLYIWDFNQLPAAEYQQQTLEVIMFNLNTDKMKTFYKHRGKEGGGGEQGEEQEEGKEGGGVGVGGYSNTAGVGHPCVSGEEATRVSGIDRLLPGSVIDSHLFTPCGYSCNGRVDVPSVQSLARSLHPPSSHTSHPSTPSSSTERKEDPSRLLVGKQGKSQQAYFTIHITPEPECSFVSFETNAVLPSYTSLVRHVVDTFQPGSFCVSLFVDAGSDVSDSRSGLQWDHPGYVTKGTTHHSFQQGYNATVSQFEAVRPDHLHLAPQFGAHALTHEPTDTSAADGVEGEAAEGGVVGGGVVVPFSSPRSSPLSAQLVLAGLNGLPSSYETVTSLSHEQMRAVTLEIAKQKRVDVQAIASPIPPPFTLNSGSDGGEGDISVTSIPPAAATSLLASARSLLSSFSPDAGFTTIDLGSLTRHFHAWSQAFPRLEPVYSMSSHTLPSGIAHALSALGCHFSVPSATALQSLLSLSIPSSRLIFHLPLKSTPQLQYAHAQHVDLITASSLAELRLIALLHDSAKVLLHVPAQGGNDVEGGEGGGGGDAGGVGFGESEVQKALALAKELDLSVVGVRVTGGGVSLSSMVKLGSSVLTAAAQVGEKLSMVQLADLPPSAFADPSTLRSLVDATFTPDVRVLVDARSFFDADLAVTLMRVLACPPPLPSSSTVQRGRKRVAYVHPAGAVGLTKRSRVDVLMAAGEDGVVVEEKEEKEEGGMELRAVPCAGVSSAVESATLPTPAAPGDWLVMYPTIAQLESLSAAGVDALPCYYIAS